MQNFQDIFETCKLSSISTFSICMTVHLTKFIKTKKHSGFSIYISDPLSLKLLAHLWLNFNHLN